MAKIYSYTKYVDPLITRTLILPDEVGTELATIGDVTYVSIPDDATLPTIQPDEIKASIKLVTLTPELKAAIKEASPHAKLISARIIEKIREQYTVDHELYLARIGVGQQQGLYTPTASELKEIADFGVFVETIRAWGNAERAKLGL
ncbi:MAG: hypothetical protein PHR19_02295 [Bacteroidales bacterium]|nr:hypothetical protein [Bacteroidales bacterium]